MNVGEIAELCVGCVYQCQRVDMYVWHKCLYWSVAVIVCVVMMKELFVCVLLMCECATIHCCFVFKIVERDGCDVIYVLVHCMCCLSWCFVCVVFMLCVVFELCPIFEY